MAIVGTWKLFIDLVGEQTTTKIVKTAEYAILDLVVGKHRKTVNRCLITAKESAEFYPSITNSEEQLENQIA